MLSNRGTISICRDMFREWVEQGTACKTTGAFPEEQTTVWRVVVVAVIGRFTATNDPVPFEVSTERWVIELAAYSL